MMDFVNYIYYLRVYPRLTHISAHLLCSLCIIYGIGVDMALEYNSLSPRAKQCVLCQPMSHSWFSAYYTVQYTVYGLPFCVLAPKSEQKKCTAYSFGGNQHYVLAYLHQLQHYYRGSLGFARLYTN